MPFGILKTTGRMANGKRERRVGEARRIKIRSAKDRRGEERSSPRAVSLLGSVIYSGEFAHNGPFTFRMDVTNGGAEWIYRMDAPNSVARSLGDRPSLVVASNHW